MLQLQILSTDGLPPARRVEFWNEAACRNLAVQVAQPLRPQSFSGLMRQADLGGVRMIEFTSDPAVVVRSRIHIGRSLEPTFVLRMQIQGESSSSQEDRKVRLRPGDFTLCDCTRPYEVTFEERASMLAVRIPRSTLLRYVAFPEAAAMVHMSGIDGPSALASRCLQEFWRSSLEWLTPSLVPRIMGILLDLVASAYTELPRAGANQGSVATALRARIVDHIERCLHEPDLSPTSIAQALRITPRYLHLLFSSEHETVGRYLLRRRLEKCSQALADPVHRDRSLSLIATRYGFKSQQHFCRAFREHYRMPPGEFRRSALQSPYG